MDLRKYGTLGGKNSLIRTFLAWGGGRVNALPFEAANFSYPLNFEKLISKIFTYQNFLGFDLFSFWF